MHFDLITIVLMLFVVLLILVGLSRSVLILGHQIFLGRVLQGAAVEFIKETEHEHGFQEAWDLIQETMALPSDTEYNTIYGSLDAIIRDIGYDIEDNQYKQEQVYKVKIMRIAQRLAVKYRDAVLQYQIKTNTNFVAGFTYSRSDFQFLHREVEIKIF